MYLQIYCLCFLGLMVQADYDFDADIFSQLEQDHKEHKAVTKTEKPNKEEVFYKLKNIETGLYLELDKTKRNLKLADASKADVQLWTLQHNGSGKFVILNKKTGYALDVPCRPTFCFVWTYPKHGKSNQQWYIESDGTIVSDHEKHNDDKLAITVKSNTKIVANPIDCEKNQRFAIEPFKPSTVSRRRMSDIPLHDEVQTRIFW